MSERRSLHEVRKEEQLMVCLNQDVQARGITAGFELLRFVPQALPELDGAAVDLTTTLFGRRLAAPVLIAPMTGGCRLGGEINRNLARAAQALGLGMGVGSQRAALVDPALSPTYQVRDVAPDILLLANLGAAQLNAGFGASACRQAVSMIGADGLCLHLNALQELQQEHGNRDFRGLRDKIAAVCADLGAPVVVKEVGWGIAGDTAATLVGCGASAIDVSGAGGTSWWMVEQLLAGRVWEEAAAAPLAGWGMPTIDALRATVRAVGSNVPVIASGGIRNGVDAAKALALGATAIAIGQPLLKPALESADAVVAALERIVGELRATLFCVGATNLGELRGTARLRA